MVISFIVSLLLQMIRGNRYLCAYQCNSIRSISGITCDEDKFMIQHTFEWVREYVHGLGICPFAARVLKDEKIIIEVLRYTLKNQIKSFHFYLFKRSGVPWQIQRLIEVHSSSSN